MAHRALHDYWPLGKVWSRTESSNGHTIRVPERGHDAGRAWRGGAREDLGYGLQATRDRRRMSTPQPPHNDRRVAAGVMALAAPRSRSRCSSASPAPTKGQVKCAGQARRTSRLQRTTHIATRKIVPSTPLLAKYLRLRREWLGADPVSGLHHRLSDDIAQLELDFVAMGVSPFVDTQPYEHDLEHQDLSPRPT